VSVKVIDLAPGIVGIRLENTAANVLTPGVVADLASAIDQTLATSTAAVLMGGEKFFCNGLDLQWAVLQDRSTMRQMFLSLCGLVLKILETPIPVVGAMKGHAIGAGKTLLVAADYRVGATGRVLIGMPEVKLGVPNPYFAELLLRFLTTESVASELIYSGKLITADEASATGLINAVTAPEEVESTALAKAAVLGGLPRLAFAQSKQQRTLTLRREIRANVEPMIDCLLDAWFGAEAQGILRATAEKLKR
jgi:enoyl-CoA hydratase/carnithine racemase